MPLVSGNGPKWSRPILARSEQRLSGLNPIRTFFEGFFRRGQRRGPTSRRPERDIDDGAAGTGDRSPLIPRSPLLAGGAAKRLGEE